MRRQKYKSQSFAMILNLCINLNLYGCIYMGLTWMIGIKPALLLSSDTAFHALESSN